MSMLQYSTHSKFLTCLSEDRLDKQHKRLILNFAGGLHVAADAPAWNAVLSHDDDVQQHMECKYDRKKGLSFFKSQVKFKVCSFCVLLIVVLLHAPFWSPSVFLTTRTTQQLGGHKALWSRRLFVKGHLRWDESLGQKDGGHEQRRHGEEQAVPRRAAAADAFLQFGNFGVKFIWRKSHRKRKWESEKREERQCERAREIEGARQRETNHYYIINSSI